MDVSMLCYTAAYLIFGFIVSVLIAKAAGHGRGGKSIKYEDAVLGLALMVGWPIALSFLLAWQLLNLFAKFYSWVVEKI